MRIPKAIVVILIGICGFIDDVVVVVVGAVVRVPGGQITVDNDGAGTQQFRMTCLGGKGTFPPWDQHDEFLRRGKID